MVNGATKSFEQCYNAQIVVDEHEQIIVASAVTQDVNDFGQLVPMLGLAEKNSGGKPKVATADTGYFSEKNVSNPAVASIELLVAVGRERKTKEVKPVPAGDPESLTKREKMRQKLSDDPGKELYKRRKAIVEPVFGQIKEARNFRRFSFRGLENVQTEWDLVCLAHNLLKLFRSGLALA